MIAVSDYIYQRSVLDQIQSESQYGSSRSGFANEASLLRVGDASFCEASFCLFFEKKKEIRLEEESIFPLRRKMLCFGSELSGVRAEITLFGEVEEARLRKLSRSLREVCDKMEIVLRGVGVQSEKYGDGAIFLCLYAIGEMKPLREATWQRRESFPGQGIVITGSIAVAGSLKQFRENKEDFKKKFPPLFVKKMENRVLDRLPFLEIEMASFFGVTAISYAQEGGLEAALYRLGDREKAGLKVYYDRLHFEQSTIEIAEFLNLNPLKMSSEGVYVMAANRAEDFVESLRAAGLPAVLAGEVTEEKKRVIVFGEEERFIESPRFMFGQGAYCV